MKKRLFALILAVTALGTQVVYSQQSEGAAGAVAKSERFREMDPSGGLMAITAMAVVFSVLILLYILFSMLGKLITGVSAKRAAKAKNAELLVSDGGTNAFSGEEQIAAIAMAIHMFQSELHDYQSSLLTITRAARPYSPWSSKIYGLSQVPSRMPSAQKFSSK